MDVRFAKTVVLVNGLLPFLLLVWDAAQDRLGANPIDFVTRTTGTLTLIFLLLSLAVTPARQLFGLPWLGKFRRMLGLYAFFYGLLHFLTYVWLDQFFALSAIATDVLGRPFIAVGLAAFFFLVPLAVTSTDGMIRRLGGKHWAKLHRRVYLVAILGVVHYALLVKADLTKPLVYGLLLALLLGYRVAKRVSPKAVRWVTEGPG
jgi:sulfoxide reductase heme-binding subunit YedZ